MQNLEISKAEESRYNELCQMAFNFARSGECEILEKMIIHGLNPNLKNEKGNSLLMLASYNNHAKTTQMLLNRGANANEKNDHGQTPLAGAAFKGYFEIVKILIKNGANANITSGLNLTPYAFAVMFGRDEIAKFLSEISNKKIGIFSKIWFKISKIFK